MNWFLFWLFLHITAAVIAFGPIFVFPIVGTLVAKSPKNAHFALEVNERIELRLVIPFALSMLVSGSGLIWTANVNFFQTPYLIVAVALYLASLIIALAILVPNTRRLLHFTAMIPADADLSGPPPPPMAALIRRSQMFGGLTTGFFLVIIFLMIIQPGGITPR